MNISELVSQSLTYVITWSESAKAPAYYCAWRIDPCLVIISSPDIQYKLYVQIGKKVRCYQAEPGDTLLIPAGIVHRFEAAACELRGMNIQYSILGGIDVLSFYKVPFLLSGQAAKAISSLIEQIVKITGRRSALHVTDISENYNLRGIAVEKRYIFQLLAEILSFSYLLPNSTNRLQILQKIGPALTVIEERLSEKIRVEYLAQASLLSVHRFSVVFKSIMNVSPHQYILKRRLDRAMLLLANSSDSISDIAVATGFYDQPHFTKFFKLHLKLSPSYYRKDIQRRLTGAWTQSS